VTHFRNTAVLYTNNYNFMTQTEKKEQQMHDHHSYVQVNYVHNCTAVLYTNNS